MRYLLHPRHVLYVQAPITRVRNRTTTPQQQAHCTTFQNAMRHRERIPLPEHKHLDTSPLDSLPAIIRSVGKRLLLLPRVPLQRSRNAIDPVLPRVAGRHDVRKRIPRRGNGHVVARAELDPVPPLLLANRVPNNSTGVVGGEGGATGPTGRAKGKEKKRLKTYRSLPSKLAHDDVRASYGTPSRSTTVSGMMMGRKDSVCAQMAVTRITGLSGWHSEPPAARL